MGSSRILIVGGSGAVGRSVSLASARLGHPTFVLVRDPSSSDPAKTELLDTFKAHGITLLKGDLSDADSLVAALKLVDIVISVVGTARILDQLKLLDAIVQVGTIKRFLPSEFGYYPEGIRPVLQEIVLDNKAKVLEAVKKSGVPYTCVLCGAGASWYLRSLWQDDLEAPPRDEITINGDGNAKAVIIDNDDLGTYTILGADDPRTENKFLFLKPEGIYKSQNELVAIWEKKIGHTLKKTYIPEEKMRKIIKGYKSDVGNDGVEVSALYPDVKYTSASEYLDRFV